MSTSTLSQSVAGLSAADAAFYQEHGWVIASNVIEDTLIEETLEGLRQHWSGHRDHTIPGANKHFADWMPGDGRTVFAVGDPMQSIYSLCYNV